MTLSPYAAPGIPKTTNLSMSLIEESTCKVFDLPIKQVRSKSRKAELVLCRQLTLLLSRELLKLNYRDLGAFYHTDHTTAMHSVRRAKDLIDTESELAEKVKTIKTKSLFGL